MQSPMYVGPPLFKANQYMFTTKGSSSRGLPQSPMYVGPPPLKANQYMFTTKGSSSQGLPHPRYTSQFSQARDAYHQVPSEFAPSMQTTTTPTTATPYPLSKKELEVIRKRENIRLHEQYHKEVKESLVENRDIHVHIPIDATCNIIGLKAKWQNVVKDIVYRIVDLKIQHWDRHPQEYKDEIYTQVEAHFIYNPPLQDGYIEKYLRDHLTST